MQPLGAAKIGLCCTKGGIEALTNRVAGSILTFSSFAIQTEDQDWLCIWREWGEVNSFCYTVYSIYRDVKNLTYFTVRIKEIVSTKHFNLFSINLVDSKLMVRIF